MKNKFFYLFIALIGILSSCENEKIPSLQTNYVKSVYTNLATVTLTSSIWSKTPYYIVPLNDLSIGKVDLGDSAFNENGGYNGINSFGNSVNLIIKSVYSNNKLYILAEWNDSTLNPTNKIWQWKGAKDVLKNLAAPNWTVQKSDDKFIIKFDKPSGSLNKADVWAWSSGLSDPMGYAIDMVEKNDNSVTVDAGTSMFAKNGTSFKSGPIYEFNGIQQIVKPDGSKAGLDPLYYLFNKAKIKGDPQLGEITYELCKGCHSEKPTLSSMSRQSIKDYVVSDEHPGKDDVVAGLSDADIDNIITYYRGKFGIPGYYLQTPSGSIADVWASSNISTTKINVVNTKSYKVLLSRDLNNGNNDDINFETKDGNEYNISLYLYNADSVNFIGIENQKLIFKQSWDEK